MWGHIATGSVVTLVASPAHAVSPKDSLANVFTYNPTIAAERAQADAAAIQVDIAKADRRFDFRVQARAERSVESYGPLERADYSVSVSLRASIALTSGGYTSARIAEREAGAAAAQADFEDTQNIVLSQAVDAHVNVARDRALLQLQQEQSSVLLKLLDSAKARAKLGDLTRTDVDQAKARLAASQARVAQAEANLTSSAQSYWTFTGTLPAGELGLDDDLEILPSDDDTILEMSQAPALRSADLKVAEARAQVRSARALGRPSLSLFAQYESRPIGQSGILRTERNSAEIGFSFKIPLYQGGSVRARVRAARSNEAMLIEQRTGVERTLLAEIRAKYARLQAEDEAVRQGRLAVTSAMLAKTVIIAQNAVGERSFLDVLNAQQDLLEAQRRVVEARTNRISVAYQILASLGRLDDIASAWRSRSGTPDISAAKQETQSLPGVTFAQDLRFWDLRQLRKA